MSCNIPLEQEDANINDVQLMLGSIAVQIVADFFADVEDLLHFCVLAYQLVIWEGVAKTVICFQVVNIWVLRIASLEFEFLVVW